MTPVNVDAIAAESSETIYTSATAELVKITYGCGCIGYRVHLDGHPKPSELAKVNGMIPDTHFLTDTDVIGGSVTQHYENEDDCQAPADAV
ncbi:hypothetical protein [Nonomuraea sp. NPDC023979]|uniref:hypothetical protein n=1 Tax=Nonomuraea sp. NPDC023979 TaxID=3154796 RepID=UPI0033D3729E